MSPPLPPPGPEYQAGELSHFEQAFENGDYQTETEEQGFFPSMQKSAGQGFTSQPQPEFVGGSWGTFPYDYMFLTGQYPAGTVSHFSSSNEQGNDNWQDIHYVRYHYPYNTSPAQQTETAVTYPSAPVKSPMMAAYGQGGAAAGAPASHGNFMQPVHYEVPTLSQAGGSNLGKVSVTLVNFSALDALK